MFKFVTTGAHDTYFKHTLPNALLLLRCHYAANYNHDNRPESVAPSDDSAHQGLGWNVHPDRGDRSTTRSMLYRGPRMLQNNSRAMG